MIDPTPSQFVGTYGDGTPGPWYGLAADRPTASRGNVGMLYFSTDTDGGTLYQCQYASGAGFSWVKIAGPVTPPTTSAPSWVSPPASSSSSGSPGQMAYDSGAIYWCHAPSSWGKAIAQPTPW